MKKTVGSTTTFYVGNWFEVMNGAATMYYYFGAQRVAMQDSSGVTYLHGDHLGSTSVTSGAISSGQTYYAFGAVRTKSGTLPTDYTFTGQKVDKKIDGSDGLMDYGRTRSRPLELLLLNSLSGVTVYDSAVLRRDDRPLHPAG